MTTRDLDEAELKQWIGREETANDVVSPSRVDALNATLDRAADPAKAGDLAPHGIHWCLAPHIAAADAIGPDGHEERGRFLPPVPLPRRLWAASRIAFLDRFRVGDTVERRSSVTGIALKAGRSGPLCFVSVTHVFATARDAALIERQDLVYRGGAAVPAPAAPLPHPPAETHRPFVADATMLFRYSALTFNGHRIHYDRDYCIGEEGYPGLVVHAPLLATLLLDLAAGSGGDLTAFSFRGRHPLFDGQPATLNAARTADGTELWIADAAGTDIMTAEASTV